MGKAIGWLVALIVVGAAIMYATGMMTVRQTQEAELPDVSITGGQMPKADVDVGSVDVGSETRTVEVPTVDVVPPASNGAAPAN